MQQASKGIPKSLIIGVVVLAVVGLLGFRACSPGPTSSIPRTGDQTTAQEGTLGRAFAAVQVDQNGCPVNTTSTFNSTDTIYAGFERSDIPSGTSLFARLSLDGRALEDTDEITADRDIRSCVWFEFQPTGARGFQRGSYTVDFFVNGNQADQVRFDVRDSGSGGSSRTGALTALDLGRVTTASGVDSQGCPIDRETRFRANDEVYVAYNRSLIPAGTRMYARLIYENRVIEQTNPITAEQDMDSCVWFVFDSPRGFEAGDYQAEVYINGSRADRLNFDVD